MFIACANIDRKYEAHVGEQLLLVCAARDFDVIAGSDTPTVIGCHVT